MEMLIGGAWQPAASGCAEEVTSPFDGAVIGTVPVAGAGDVRAALDRAEAGAVTWRRTPAFERMKILMRAADQHLHLCTSLSVRRGTVTRPYRSDALDTA